MTLDVFPGGDSEPDERSGASDEVDGEPGHVEDGCARERCRQIAMKALNANTVVLERIQSAPATGQYKLLALH